MSKLIRFSLCLLLLLVLWKDTNAMVRKVVIGDGKNISNRMKSDALRAMREAVKTDHPKQYLADYFRRSYSNDGVYTWICEEYSGYASIPDNAEKYLLLTVRSTHKTTPYILYAVQY